METINTFNELRQAVLDVITADETTIQEAYFEERSEFDGSPAAVVGVSQNDALYNSQHLDRMTFVFQVRIYIPINVNEDIHDVEIRMGKAYWETLRLFKARDVLGTAADFVEPIPSIWGFEERGEGVFRFCEINIRCAKFLSNQPA
jgi:hypothetical protein